MKKKLLSLIIFSIAFSLQGQVSLKSVEEDYYDFLSLQGLTERPFLNYRTLSDNKWDLKNAENSDLHLWKDNKLESTLSFFDSRLSLKIFGPDWFNSFNTTTPYGQNDGALWQGRGYNTSLTTGVSAEAFGLNLTFKPQISFSQNLDFEIMKSVYESEYGYFWNVSIDKPQRFGNRAFFTFDFGDSEIRYTWKKLTLGYGTQNVWLGPAYLNPMLHSNNAGTYPKLDFGLKPVEVIIPGTDFSAGFIEGRIFVGQLTESPYFDTDSKNNKRMIALYSASYAPSFIPGFTIGLNKVCVSQWNKNSIKYINPFYSDNTIGEGKNAGEDMKASIMADWLFPSVGFELYGEGAVDDHTSSQISNPFHTFTYTLGIKQILDFMPDNNIKFQFTGEVTNLEMSQDFQLQWAYGGLYGHGGIIQGYTQKGQVLGAGSSIGGNSQYAELKVYHPKFSAKIFFHRFVPDMNFVLSKAVYDDASYGATLDGKNTLWEDWYASYETYFGGGTEIDWFVTPSLILSAGITGTYINKPMYKQFDETGNFNFRIGVEYNFPL